VLGADQVLVGRNQTRRAVNGKVRALNGRDPAGPEIGDRLVCLKNDKTKGLLNGALFDVTALGARDGQAIRLDVVPDDKPKDDPTPVVVLQEFFSGSEDGLSPHERRGFDELTYGYALTVHKAQGSQWNDVVLFDEAHVFREHRARWLYTGLTRAAERVTVVQS
jgi:exodeoxyribonuclease-5